MIFVGFGLLILSLPTLFSVLWDDECTIFPRGFIPDGEHREYQVPVGCINGTIIWNYPKEYVIVYLVRETPNNFSVCLRPNLGGHNFTLVDTTRETQTFPQGSWPCLDSHLGNVTMEIHAPKDMVYMSAIDYFIQIWK
ncbi:uncharacterized protein LOC125664922 [Ostrea edulis]|uniref:uncharacterized protein LOC125664922 n=1 Tax=Ostrea edulis TaxID=37623 RepID=UPI0020960326|nr:uncharacterized protein LOC125664922 [Ostrea edulis]